MLHIKVGNPNPDVGVSPTKSTAPRHCEAGVAVMKPPSRHFGSGTRSDLAFQWMWGAVDSEPNVHGTGICWTEEHCRRKRRREPASLPDRLTDGGQKWGFWKLHQPHRSWRNHMMNQPHPWMWRQICSRPAATPIANRKSRQSPSITINHHHQHHDILATVEANTIRKDLAAAEAISKF